MSVTRFRGAPQWALMVALVFGAGALARAEDENAKIIRIGPADAKTEAPKLPAPEGGQRQPEAPKYWIGLLGGPITPEVRHHVDVPENQGILIREIVPDSPAAKAGLEQYDILLRANDAELHEMTDLVDLVRTQGEQKNQIALEVLRHGKRDTVYVTPTERPANVAVHNFGGEGMPGELHQFFGPGGPNLQQFFGEGGPEGGRRFDFRHFGPGVIVGGEGIGQMPNGVSITVKKENDQPAHITVKRGNETWEVTGDDPESLKALPEDLRPFVERILHGGPANLNLDLPAFGAQGGPAFDGERIQKRLEEMERRMQEMQERMFGGRHTDEQPAESNDEAK
jgi:membrane-associated protease RseP (regulator of RpoE activity)